VRALKVSEQVAGLNAQSPGNPQKRVQADPLLTPFNLSDIDRVQIRFFRQLFLAEASLGPATADRGPKGLELLSGRRHSPERKQESAKRNTPNMGALFLLAVLSSSEKLRAINAGSEQVCRA
jgi:hypothetical protein